MNYSYVTSDNLKNRQHYMYSHYEGMSFLEVYRNNRQLVMENILQDNMPEVVNIVQENDYLKSLKSMCIDFLGLYEQVNNKNDGIVLFEENQKFDTTVILEGLLSYVINQQQKDNSTLCNWMDRFSKSFEVRKRVYDEYDENFKPTNLESYHNIYLYILLGLLLGIVYCQTGNLKFLNTLLKLNDTVISVFKDIVTPEEKVLLYFSLLLEKTAVNNLCKKKGMDTIC